VFAACDISETDVIGMIAVRPVIELLDPPDPGIAVWARIRFDLDLATEFGARTALRAICRTAVTDRRVIIEFGPRRFVALCGLRVLLEAADSVRGRGGELAVVGPPPSLRRMHTVLRVGSALPLLDEFVAAPVSPSRPMESHVLGA
jgi:anti-anti-sigma regulatory factor